jgi:hypothetical protein
VRLREEEDRVAYFVPQHPHLASLTWGVHGEGGRGNDNDGGWASHDDGGSVERDA